MHRRSRRPYIVLSAALFFLFPGLFVWTGVTAARAASRSPLCGNGIVNAGEQCDPGSVLGSPDCNSLCQKIELEPPGLPFGVPTTPIDPEGPSARIFSPGLECRSPGVREDARNGSEAVVRYRIHLCRDAAGLDSFTPAQVRETMGRAAAEFAAAGIVLEEESLVTFSEPDCILPLGDSDWTDKLVDSTPPGVLSVTFVSSIVANAQFQVGGFCYFFGPICVNAGAYETLVVHELGHFFGLSHTFECANGTETPSTCGHDGDLICDTPPDRGPSGVNQIARCEDGSYLNGSCSGSCGDKHCTDGSTPDGYNWMSYYHCKPGRFSDEQLDFMRCTLDHELAWYNGSYFASTTTTTLEASSCGDVNDDGQLTASDALAVLRAGVGTFDCAEWQCDYDGSGTVSAIDALGVLRAAIGADEPGHCPAQ